MSSKKKTHGTRASQDDGRRKAEDVRAMETARELRARREAAQGPAPIDNELHRELPLARVAYGLLAVTVFAFMVSRLGVYLGNHDLESVASIATTLLFITTFVTWFISRHQAKSSHRSATGAKLPLAASEHKLNAAGSKQLLMPRSSCHSPVDRRPRSRRPTWPYSACLRTSGSAGRILS